MRCKLLNLTNFYKKFRNSAVKRIFTTSLLLFLLISTSTIYSGNYAIIITGDTPTSSSNSPVKNWNNAQGANSYGGYDEFWNDTYMMWETLYSMGFEDENIFVLYGDGDDYNSANERYRAFDNFGLSSITDYSATTQNVNNIFNWLANGNTSQGIPQMTNDDFLFIYTFDHGNSSGNNNSTLILMDGYITDTDFASLADQLSYDKRVVWMQQCYSGGFIDNLENVKSVIATACKGNELAYRADDVNPDGYDALENEVTNGNTYHHGEFNYHMINASNLETIIGNNLTDPDTDNNSKTSIQEIFNWEDQKDSRTSYSTPQYSDLGGIGNSVFVDVAPSVPSNFQASWNGDHPLLTWTLNPERDMQSYKIYKMIVGETGWACVATVSSQTTSWTDNTVSPAAKFDPLYTIKYKIKAVDLVNNNSDFTAEQSVTGTTNTFWKLTENSSNEFITDYKLFANYPNPFNPSTNIEFQIPRSSFVNLVVYNSLGEEVAVLVNQNLTEGKYSVNFNAENLPSGVYIYSLQVNDFVQNHKMTLLR